MKELHFKKVPEWREWLSANHDTEEGIWLVYYKKHTGIPSIGYEQSVEEALCFGWIDSTIKKLDENRYVRKFTPRKVGSVWSALNKKRVAALIKKNRMTEAGMKMVDVAKKNGQWNKSDRPDISPKPSEDFKIAQEKNERAKQFVYDLAPSYRKQFIRWINVARRQETRQKRIRESILLLEKGKKLGLK